MHNFQFPAGRGRVANRRVASLAALAVGSAVLAGPALAQAAPTLAVDAVKDSAIATGLPFGATVIEVTRPDALKGSPVVIGQFGGFASPFLPFSVNTITPTAFNPQGDCWQKGKLTLPGGAGLTPDIRPGDTVSVTGGPSFKVPADAELKGGPSGPIEGCLPVSAYGQNSVTAASGGSGADVLVSGKAQPLATGVSVSATDGTAKSTPVDATLKADGTWSASIPATDVALLADGTVRLDAVYAVPDVATGAPANISGVPMTIEKKTVAGDVSVAPETPPAASDPAPAAAAPSAQPALGRLTYVRATSKVYLAHARTGGIRVAFYVPSGARVVRVRLSRGGKTKYLSYVSAAPAGTRQVVHLKGKSLQKLRTGTHTLTVSAGPSRSQLGAPIKSSVLVR
jgi:hypothetical protein